MYSFSACMASKISQLKFGAHEFERVQWSCIKRLKRISGLGPPNSPSGHHEGPISSSLGYLLPIASSKGPKLMYHRVIRGSISRFSHQVI